MIDLAEKALECGFRRECASIGRLSLNRLAPYSFLGLLVASTIPSV